MRDSPAEIVGFLCRWCLLALAGGTAVLGAWAGAVATQAVADETGTSIILPDGFWGPANSGRPHLSGCLSKALRRPNPAILMSLQAGRIQTLIGAKRVFYVLVPHAGPGANPVELRGIPYGPLAFQTAAATCFMPAAGRKIFLLDARTAASGRQADGEPLRQCLAELRRRGEVALFHPGPPDAFVHSRRQSLQAGMDLLMLCTVKDSGQAMQTLWDTAWALGGKATVITDDRELAYMAAGDGAGRFHVHLISAEAETRPSERLKQHPSLEKFKEYLAGQPIAD